MGWGWGDGQWVFDAVPFVVVVGVVVVVVVVVVVDLANPMGRAAMSGVERGGKRFDDSG